MRKEYIKLFWQQEYNCEEPVLIIYEVNLDEERYATRCIYVYDDGSVELLEDKEFGFVTEVSVDSVEEMNKDWNHGIDKFWAVPTTEEEFETVWKNRKYEGSLQFPR